jgi:hypothetical protein
VELAKTERGQAHYKGRRTGEDPLPDRDEHTSAFRWWSERTRCFGDWQTIRDRVAVLNIGAYHSRAFWDEPMLAALPSSRVSLAWAQSVLFPQAISGERIVICLRSHPFWGLEAGRHYGLSLYAPYTARGGYMHKNDMRGTIIREVKHRLNS